MIFRVKRENWKNWKEFGATNLSELEDALVSITNECQPNELIGIYTDHIFGGELQRIISPIKAKTIASSPQDAVELVKFAINIKIKGLQNLIS